MSNRSTNQERNIVGGHQAAGDVNVTTHHHASSRPTTMQTLLRRFRQEMESDAEFRDVIASLKYYLDPTTEEDPLDLEAKLKAAGRDAEVHEATGLKELFAKKLAKHQLSLAAQEIFAWVLGHIQTLFRTKVRPLVENGAAPEEINEAVLESVIEPVIASLEGNDLILNYQELRGMLYYLTGNCHVRWHADA